MRVKDDSLGLRVPRPRAGQVQVWQGCLFFTLPTHNRMETGEGSWVPGERSALVTASWGC